MRTRASACAPLARLRAARSRRGAAGAPVSAASSRATPERPTGIGPVRRDSTSRTWSSRPRCGHESAPSGAPASRISRPPRAPRRAPARAPSRACRATPRRGSWPRSMPAAGQRAPAARTRPVSPTSVFGAPHTTWKRARPVSPGRQQLVAAGPRRARARWPRSRRRRRRARSARDAACTLGHVDARVDQASARLLGREVEVDAARAPSRTESSCHENCRRKRRSFSKNSRMSSMPYLQHRDALDAHAEGAAGDLSGS